MVDSCFLTGELVVVGKRGHGVAWVKGIGCGRA